MEQLRQRKKILLKVLSTLETSLLKFGDTLPSNQYYMELRDSVIQRFEYSIDNFWKFLKLYLEIKYGGEIAKSPKAVLQQASDMLILTPEEVKIFAKMITDRNLTSHTYNEDLADEISMAALKYHKCMVEKLETLEI